MQKDSQASRTTLFVGLVQQSCTADKAGNMEKLAQGIARAKHGPQYSAVML